MTTTKQNMTTHAFCFYLCLGGVVSACASPWPRQVLQRPGPVKTETAATPRPCANGNGLPASGARSRAVEVEAEAVDVEAVEV